MFKKTHKTCRWLGYVKRCFNSIHNICTNFCCKHRVNEYNMYHIIQCKCVHKLKTIQHTHYHLRFICFDAKSRRRRLSWGELGSVCKKTEWTKRFKYVVLYSFLCMYLPIRTIAAPFKTMVSFVGNYNFFQSKDRRKMRHSYNQL